jgi:gluconokinase
VVVVVMTVVLMGVAGAGKTTVGQALAGKFGLPFLEGDAFHSPSSIAKLSRSEPLTDDDRWPWLDAINRELHNHPEGAVVACSALTPAYRARLGRGLADVRYVLPEAPAEVLADRLAQREGHFVGPGLLPSQLQLLDPPPDAIRVDATLPLAVVVDDIATRLASR